MQAKPSQKITAEDLKSGRAKPVCRGGYYSAQPVKSGAQMKLDVAQPGADLHRRWVDKIKGVR